MNRKESKRLQVAYYKESNPCVDCGGFFSAVAMDFDHEPGTKFKSISRMVRDEYSMARIKEEIEKCDLVCSNCHRVRTYERSPRP